MKRSLFFTAIVVLLDGCAQTDELPIGEWTGSMTVPGQPPVPATYVVERTGNGPRIGVVRPGGTIPTMDILYNANLRKAA